MKRSRVRALLDKARATLNHDEEWTNKFRRHCAIAADFADRGVYGHGWIHRSYASALLDGLDVHDVTEAGG